MLLSPNTICNGQGRVWAFVEYPSFGSLVGRKNKNGLSGDTFHRRLFGGNRLCRRKWEVHTVKQAEQV